MLKLQKASQSLTELLKAGYNRRFILTRVAPPISSALLETEVAKKDTDVVQSRGGWTRSCDIRSYAILYGDFCIKSAKKFTLSLKRIPKE